MATMNSQDDQREALCRIARGYQLNANDSIDHLAMILNLPKRLEVAWGSPEAIGGLERTRNLIRTLLDGFQSKLEGPSQIVSVLLLPVPRRRGLGKTNEIDALWSLLPYERESESRDWRNTTQAWVECLRSGIPPVRLTIGPLRASLDEITDLTSAIAVESINRSSPKEIRREPLTLSVVVSEFETTSE